MDNTTLNDIIRYGSMGRWNRGTFDEQKTKELRTFLLERLPQLQAPEEAERYRQELELIVLTADPERQRGIFFAARALASDATALLMTPVPTADPVATPAGDHPGSETYLDRVVELPDEGDDSKLVADLADDNLGLEALEQAKNYLEQNLIDRSRASLETARSLLNGDTAYEPQFEQIEGQIRALQNDIPLLQQQIAEPMAVWLRDGEAGVGRCREQLAELGELFGPDDPRIKALRSQLDGAVERWRSVAVKVESLRELEGDALEAVISELRDLVPADLPDLIQANKRLEAYKAERERQRLEESRRASIAAAIARGRELKARADNLYDDISIDSSTITNLREELDQATFESIVPKEENPLDAETFDYYDLIFANRFRELNILSEEEAAVATMLNAGELAKAYKTQLQIVSKLEREDVTNLELNKAKTKLNEIEERLRRLLETDVRETTARINKDFIVPKRYDQLEQPQEDLKALRDRIKEAELSIDEKLEQELADLERSVNQFAAKDGRAKASLQQAVRQAQDKYFVEAFKSLDDAKEEASWRSSEVDRRRGELQTQCALHIDESLQRLSSYVRSGDEKSSLTLMDSLGPLPLSEEQRIRLSGLRESVNQQRINREQVEKFRKEVESLLEQTKSGKDLDRVGAQIGGLRTRLGPRDMPNLPGETWNEFDDALRTAEQRIHYWQEYVKKLLEAQMSATNGDQAGVRRVFDDIQQQLGAQGYLPIHKNRLELLDLATKATLSERIRARIERIFGAIVAGEPVTASEIRDVIRLASVLPPPGDEWIRERCKTLNQHILPPYTARSALKAAIDSKDFELFDRTCEKLDPTLREDESIVQLNRERWVLQEGVEFQVALRTVLQSVRPHFQSAWENPQEFQQAIATIEEFAEKLPPQRHEGSPRLTTLAIAQLKSLSRLLKQAQETSDFSDAQMRAEQARVMIPVSPLVSTNPLYPYTDDLSPLRELLDDLLRILPYRIEDEKKRQEEFNSAERQYRSVVTNESDAFTREKLKVVRQRFNELGSRSLDGSVSDPRVILFIKKINDILNEAQNTRKSSYIDTINNIIRLLERIDECNKLFLEDPVGAQEPVDRRPRIEKELAAIKQESAAICAHEPGNLWLGVSEYRRYSTKEKRANIATTLSKADKWIKEYDEVAKSPKIADMDSAIAEGEEIDRELQLILKDPERSDPAAGMVEIYDHVSQRCGEIGTKIGELKRVRDALEKSRQRRRLRSRLLLITILGVVVVLSVPRMRDRVFLEATIALVGTITPTPTPTTPPEQIAAATADARATITAQTPTVTPTPTPTLTPTPIPPQQAIVIYPGQISVRSRPDLGLSRMTSLIAGDDAILTAFSDTADGVRWYRIDIPAKNLAGVWLLAEADNGRGQIYPTLRFIDNNGELRRELEIPYQP